jgi:nucleoside-diphosphate-sugar epimerase
MEDASALLDALRCAVPEGVATIGGPGLDRLRELTAQLVDLRPDAVDELERFRRVRERGFDLPAGELADWLGGRTVLVTGGTGCIGSKLVEHLAGLRPGRLVSVSRGYTRAAQPVPGADYLYADVRDRARLDEVFSAVRPHVVFHVAAQRSPAQAEIEVARTVGTNVLGTRNVLEAAVAHGVADVVCASTGKALRPYSPDIYAASKRVAEWLAARAAASCSIRFAATRFTHVVDNSIVARRIENWCDEGVIRLHSPNINFYVQSALESVQLLLSAGLDCHPGRLRLHALRDLGWPVNLLDLALGMLAETGSDSPIYLSGYEPGYEEVPFPGLYDPRTAGDLSPLINAFEAVGAVPGHCDAADAFDLPAPCCDTPVLVALARVEAACLEAPDDPAQDPAAQQRVRAALDELSWALLDNTLHDLPKEQLARAVRLASARHDALNPVNSRILAALRAAEAAAADPAGSVARSA